MSDISPLITDHSALGTLPSPIAPKEGIALLESMSMVEWAVQAAICGDNGPLTSSPNQRRNMALVMADLSARLCSLATRIDPLAEPASEDKVIAWEAIRHRKAALPEDAFRLQPGAFEEALARV